MMDSVGSVTSRAASTIGDTPLTASETSGSNDSRRHSRSSLADESYSSLPTMDTTDSDHTLPSQLQTTGQGKLSSEDFVELTRISRKKEAIEHHIENLQSWSPWDPFRNVSSYSPDADVLQRSKETLATLSSDLHDRQDQCRRLEDDVQHFNLQEMKRLRTVAKAVSKRHLSGPDTDLLELALETVYALDKLLRLLREQRTQHDLTQLRLQWEHIVCFSWQDVIVLRRDIEAFEHKCKALMSPRHDSNTSSAPDDTNVQTSLEAEKAKDAPSTSRTRRAASLSHSSWKLAAESVKLESSRLVLRIRSFDSEKVRPAGKLLDLLIDQRQIPEKMIDEQEKLEDALPQPSTIEARSLQVSASLGLVRTPTPEAPEGDPSPIQEAKIEPLPHTIGKQTGNGSTREVANGGVLAKHPSRSVKAASRSRKSSSSSLVATPSKQSINRYCSDPRDVLDVAIGNIVNRLPMSVSIRSAKLGDSALPPRSSKVDALCGQYLIGDPEPRLCFCRILPSSMVMVRVGGGWQGLSEFLTQHYTHLSARGWDSDAELLNAITIKSGQNLVWSRSASGPVESPRLRSKSSFGSLKSREPIMKKITSPTPSKDHASHHIPQATRAQENAAEFRELTIATPSKTSTLSTSGSSSSIVIHSPSPSR